MSVTLIGILGLCAMFAMLMLRIPIAITLFVVGFVGIWTLRNLNSAWNLLASETYTLASSAELIVVPLFILMGNVATHSGMSRRLYDAAYAMVGSVRGGLASATVIGCGGFAALSGSSVATALTIGKVSLAEMDRFDYDPRLSTGVVAAGGTLGILIPPSTGFVIYAIMTSQSIGKLFLAGVVPGLLLLGLFIATIYLLCLIWPALGPRGPKVSLRGKAQAMIGAIPILSVILLTIGGIYTGFFSPVEAAAIGAGLVIAIGFVSRTLDLRLLWLSTRDSVVTTATVMMILIGAHLINPFLALSEIPRELGIFIEGLSASPTMILAVILACYLVLGCFLEGFAMLVLSIPIFYPIIVQLGIDPILFGVLVVIVLEMGLISPPVGVNVFIVKSVARHVPLSQIFRGVAPFWFAMLVLLVLLVTWPQLVLFLPDTMIN